MLTDDGAAADAEPPLVLSTGAPFTRRLTASSPVPCPPVRTVDRHPPTHPVPLRRRRLSLSLGRLGQHSESLRFLLVLSYRPPTCPSPWSLPSFVSSDDRKPQLFIMFMIEGLRSLCGACNAGYLPQHHRHHHYPHQL